MANERFLSASELDFDRLKTNLRKFLEGQEQFKDYDFEGSNLSALLDVLTYNTHLNALYLNFIGSEMFLDTSTLRESIVSHAKEYGFVWSIQDGEIITTPKNIPLTSGEAFVITAATGMIDSPTTTDLGVEVKTLLNPQLVPNTAFIIESLNSDVVLGNLFFEKIQETNASGTYKILESIFKGDSYDGEWTTLVKGVLINA